MLLFGTAGIPLSSRDKSTAGGIKRIKELGLDCMEIEFVRGVKMGRETAQNISDVASSEKIALTVHAPYFINLSSEDKSKVRASIQRILDSARIGALASAKSVVFHPAYYCKKEPTKVYDEVKSALLEISETMRLEGIKIDIRPETTGKLSQFGTVNEIIALSKDVSGVFPCIDFSHLYARTGGNLNSYDDFIKVLELLEMELCHILQNMHIHVSGIAYGLRGETHHTDFKDSSFNYKALLRALHYKGVSGFLICESPSLEKDVLLLKDFYSTI